MVYKNVAVISLLRYGCLIFAQKIIEPCKEASMPKREDVKKVLIIGSGPSSSVRPANSTIQVPRRARPCASLATKYS